MTNFINELKKFFTVPKNLLFMIGIPMIFTVFFGNVYRNDYLNTIPITVYDMDNSSLSRSLVEEFDKNPRYTVDFYSENLDEVQQAVESTQVYMGVVIPSDFEKDVKSKKSSKVALIVDATNMAVANNALASATEIISTVNAGVNLQFLEGKNVPPSLSKRYVNIFEMNNRTLWDPKLSYKYYVMPGMILVLVQQLFLSIFVVNVIEDKTNIFYKILIHTIISSLTFLICTSLLKHVLGINIIGNMLTSTFLSFMYLISLSSIALVLALSISSPLRATQLCMLLSVPSFLTAGYVWPVMKMPQLSLYIIKALWPLIYMIAPLRDYLIKGALPYYFKSNMLQMTVFACIWFFIAFLISKKSRPGLDEED